MHFVKDWGRNDDEDFADRKVCDEVGLFPKALKGGRRKDMFCNWISMTGGLH